MDLYCGEERGVVGRVTRIGVGGLLSDELAYFQGIRGKLWPVNDSARPPSPQSTKFLVLLRITVICTYNIEDGGGFFFLLLFKKKKRVILYIFIYKNKV